MPKFTLVIGNKNYSSWSLRPWLLLRYAEIPFEEVRIALFEPGYKEKILRYSRAGKVPALVEGERVIWDSLAICEYVAEQFPEKFLWPQDAAERAHARSVCAEMHSGFSALRTHMPMNIRAHLPGAVTRADVAADIARIIALWRDCFARYATRGAFLFGSFSCADAMYAPVCMRFLTYGVELPEDARRYVLTISTLPAMQEWIAAARSEQEVIGEDEPYRPTSAQGKP